MCRGLLQCTQQTVPVACSYAASSKSLEDRLGLPPKPKKPLTPYFRFMKEMRPILIKENPTVPLTDVVKMIAKKWESVDEVEKAKLQDLYKRDQITYIEQRAKYDSKITEDQKRDLQKLRHEIAVAKERRAVRKRIKELGRPKKPASAFLKFIVAERAKTNVDKQSYKEWHRKVCEKWARLSEDEKEEMKKQCKKEMEEYKQQISKWEEKMVRMGNIDVVRQEAMIEPSISQKGKGSKLTSSVTVKKE